MSGKTIPRSSRLIVAWETPARSPKARRPISDVSMARVRFRANA
jgi:hypothetical protein